MSAACERGAVDTLLVTDSLFRSLEEGTRRAYVDLVEAAREQGATVHVFSSLHVSGEALEQVRSSDGRIRMRVLLLVCVLGRLRARAEGHGAEAALPCFACPPPPLTRCSTCATDHGGGCCASLSAP